MTNFKTMAISVFAVLIIPAHSSAQEASYSNGVSHHIIELERSALERWLVADPQGYLDLYARDVSYFDPSLEKRVDGRAALETLFAPMNDVDLSQTEPRFEMISPEVTVFDDTALLTFNLLNYRKLDPSSDHVLVAKWNGSELYRRIDGAWKIVHSHWSYTNHSNPTQTQGN